MPAGSTGTGSATATDCPGSLPCYTLRQLRAAYGIQPLLDRGIDGRGVTVALPEEAESGPARPQPVSILLQSVTDIRQDLADFDSRFGLPPAQIQVITTLAGPSASPWLAGVEEVEEVEDTELMHAVAPDATIREILVDPADVSTPAKFAATWATAVRIAARHGEVISQSGIGQDFNLGEDSWTSPEAATMNSALQDAAARHVTVVVASGDQGAIGNGSTTPAKEVILPTSDPLVLAAGGTILTANSVTGAYISETAWNTPGLPPQPGATRPATTGPRRPDYHEVSGDSLPACRPSRHHPRLLRRARSVTPSRSAAVGNDRCRRFASPRGLQPILRSPEYQSSNLR